LREADVIPDDVAKLVDWIPLKRYLELYKETEDTVLKRIQRGHWQAGIHYSRPEGGGRWISIKAINEWAKTHVER
jgi:hypothetical protein